MVGLIPLDGSFLDNFAYDPRELAALDAQFMFSSSSRQMIEIPLGPANVTSVRVDSGGYGYSSTNPPKVRLEGGLGDGGVAATGRAVLGRNQSVVATPACWSKSSWSLKASAGVFQPRVLRGLVLRA